MELPKITSAFLNLTNACNLACRYCFVHQRPEYISLETAKDAVDWLAGNAEDGPSPSINFFGGEPMLMWDDIIVPLTKYVRTRYGDRFVLSMTSNCTLLSEERAKFMKDNGVGLLFSMDGDRATQDRNRPMHGGGSSFDVLEEKIPIILKYFPTVIFRSTVTPDTCGQLFHNVLFAEKKGFREVFTMPNCFTVWRQDQVATLQTQLRAYSEHYIQAFQKGASPIFFSQLEKSFRKIVLRNSAIERGAYRDASVCSACGKCGLGTGRYAGIDLNGDVVSCQEMFSCTDGHFRIGNIYTGVREELRTRLADEFDAGPVFGENCDTCPVNRVCDGGCVINNYLISGDIHAVPSIYCEWQRLLFREAVYLMETLGGERNEAFRERWVKYVG